MSTAHEGHMNTGVAHPDEILVIDDTRDSLKLLEEILVATGYRVRLSNDGELALRSAGIKPPALVLLDIRMPGMDGYEVCRRLKEDDKTRSIPVIFLSILEDGREKVKAFEAGGVDYINKPFHPAEVLARVNTHLALRHAQLGLEARNAELERANVRLQELDRMKSMFIAAMSHELRTPLNSVIGFSCILLNEWLGPMTGEQKEHLATVLRSGKHLLSLVNNVIDVSKIEARLIDASPEEFDVHDVVSEAVTACGNAVREKGVELKVQAVHRTMRTDRTRLLQCLLNLVANAVNYTEKGMIMVCAEIPDGGGMLELSVADTGIGIREEDLGKLFTPFVRLDSHLSSTVSGTGLGLYLARKLATEVLEGEITVQSALGEGSVFVLRVPITVSRRP